MKNDIFSISFFLNIRFMIPIANHVDGRKIYFILFYIEPFFSRLSVRQRINMIKWITGAEKKLDQKIWHCVWYALVFFQFITVLLFVFFFGKINLINCKLFLFTSLLSLLIMMMNLYFLQIKMSVLVEAMMMKVCVCVCVCVLVSVKIEREKKKIRKFVVLIHTHTHRTWNKILYDTRLKIYLFISLQKKQTNKQLLVWYGCNPYLLMASGRHF